MDGRDLFDLRATLQRQGIIFAFSGYMTEAMLGGVGEAIKQKLTIDDADSKTLRSVFAVFVEQMQNIIRYSAELAAQPSATDKPSLEIRYGILTIAQQGSEYIVQAGNLVAQKDVERLRARLSRIRDIEQGGTSGFAQGAAAGHARGGQQGRRPWHHGNRAPRIETDRIRLYRCGRLLRILHPQGERMRGRVAK